MDDRAEGEARADVARRLDADRPGSGRRRSGPMSYEIGSADDPDRPESDPEADEQRD
jgi:GTP-binding protein